MQSQTGRRRSFAEGNGPSAVGNLLRDAQKNPRSCVRGGLSHVIHKKSVAKTCESPNEEAALGIVLCEVEVQPRRNFCKVLRGEQFVVAMELGLSSV